MGAVAKSAAKQIILVTGANQGIGFATVNSLSHSLPESTILLGSRSADNATKALQQLNNPQNVKSLQIDVSSDASVKTAAEEVQRQYGRLDVLINNAGIGFGGKEDYETVRSVIDTNYHGPQRVSQAFLPLIPTDGTGRIVVVSSQVGSWTLAAAPEPLKTKLAKLDGVSTADVDSLAEQYLQAIKSDDQSTLKQWPASSASYGAYGISKMLVTAWSRLFAQQLKDKNIPVAIVCPGYCRTNMTSSDAPRSAEQGASSVIAGTKIELSQTGAMLQDGKPHPYVGRP